MTLTEEKILNALKHVIDPDLKRDLVSLGMIQNVRIENNTVSFDLLLTTPACPIKDNLKEACIEAIKRFISDDIVVNVNVKAREYKPISGEDLLPGVRHVVAVTSGKGGVGKSTVAVNLALALVQMGARVGLLDADVYGPSVPTMLGLEGSVPNAKTENGKTILLPIDYEGLKVMSIGFFIDADQAVLWRGPVASGTVRQLVQDVDWSSLDYLIVDMPPGTGDIPMTVAQVLPLTGAVIVTTPQRVAQADVRRAIAMFRHRAINKPIIGLIENMAYFIPELHPDEKYYVFGKDGGKKLAQELDVPFLGEIPLMATIAEGSDFGKPPVLFGPQPVKEAFNKVAGEVARRLEIIAAEQITADASS